MYLPRHILARLSRLSPAVMPAPARLPLRPLALTAVAALAFVVGACDIVRVPDRSTDAVAYTVTAARYNRAGASPVPLTSRIRIAYATPAGEKVDTIRGLLTSWSKLYDNADGFTPSVTARILTPVDTLRNKITNYVGVRLRAGKTVYADSSADSVTVTIR